VLVHLSWIRQPPKNEKERKETQAISGHNNFVQMPPANLVTGRSKSQDSHSALGTKAREAAISM